MFILTLGIGFWQKVGFGCFSSTLLVLLSAQAAVRSVQPSTRADAHTFLLAPRLSNSSPASTFPACCRSCWRRCASPSSSHSPAVISGGDVRIAPGHPAMKSRPAGEKLHDAPIAREGVLLIAEVAAHHTERGDPLGSSDRCGAWPGRDPTSGVGRARQQRGGKHPGRRPVARLCQQRRRGRGAGRHRLPPSAPADFVVIVGPSGCGKSSLLMMLAGLRQQSTGSVLCGGRPVTGPDPDRIGVVLQDANLFPWLTALDNVAFPLALRHVKPVERRRRALDMLRLVGLENFAGQAPPTRTLRRHAATRVSIARGLVQDPPVLLMDDPFAALDEQTRMTMGAELLRIWAATRKTIVFVTHSLQEAVYLADEVLVMSARPGSIIDRIEVDLPRPRTYEMMAELQFARLRDRIGSISGLRMRSNDRPRDLRPHGGSPALGSGDRSLISRTNDRPRDLPPAMTRWAIIAIVVVLWEVLPRAGVIPPLFLPPLSASLRVLVTDWSAYASALWVTIARGLRRVVACVLRGHFGRRGCISGSVPALRALLLPVASSLYAVPIVIVYPILTVWFGIGPASKIAFATLGGFFPTLLATAAGIRTIDPNLLLAARSMGASLPQLVVRVIIPAAIPTVLAGLRLGGVLAIVGVVVSEMLISGRRHRLSGDKLPHRAGQPARVCTGGAADRAGDAAVRHSGTLAGKSRGRLAAAIPLRLAAHATWCAGRRDGGDLTNCTGDEAHDISDASAADHRRRQLSSAGLAGRSRNAPRTRRAAHPCARHVAHCRPVAGAGAGRRHNPGDPRDGAGGDRHRNGRGDPAGELFRSFPRWRWRGSTRTIRARCRRGAGG